MPPFKNLSVFCFCTASPPHGEPCNVPAALTGCYTDVGSGMGPRIVSVACPPHQSHRVFLRRPPIDEGRFTEVSRIRCVRCLLCSSRCVSIRWRMRQAYDLLAPVGIAYQSNQNRACRFQLSHLLSPARKLLVCLGTTQFAIQSSRCPAELAQPCAAFCLLLCAELLELTVWSRTCVLIWK